MRYWLALVIIILITSLSGAQTFNQREVDLPQGLQPSDVNILYTDRQGFVWIAAGPRLYWHDGNTFREIEVSSDTTDEDIVSLYQDDSGHYWIGWGNGHIHTLKSSEVKSYRPEEGTPAVPIVSWAQDSQNQLWMCTDGEGVYVRAQNGRWFNFNVDEGFPSNETYDIVPLKKGVAVATDQGLVYCTFDGAEKSIQVLDRSSGLSDQIVKDLHHDESGVLVAFYEPFLNNLNTDLKVSDTLDTPMSDARKVLRSAGTLWWLSEDGKLYRKREAGNWFQIDSKLSGRERIKDFVADHEGHIWVLGSRGIFMIDQWYAHLKTGESVTAIAVSQNEIWYAQQGDLYHYDRNANTSERVWAGPNIILNLFKDDWDNIWCGTFDGGLLRYNPVGSSMETYDEKSGLANNNVLSISGNKSGLWVGTLGGVSHLYFDADGNVTEISSYDRAQGVSVQYIYSVHVNDAGKVYISTDGEGVLNWNGKLFKPLSGEKQDQVVLDVSSDKQGNIWWVTSEGTLQGWSAKGKPIEVPPYPEDPGKVAGIETLKDGSVLVVHDGGVHRWIPGSNKWVAYKKSFGLGLLQPELHSILVQGNMVYIGTVSGVTSLAIDHLPLKTEPKTFLYGFQLFQQRTSKASFSHDENYFTFQYVGRWYTEPAAVRYRLRLKGFDPKWIESKNTEISYPKLPPGNYTFEVVAGVDGHYPEEEIQSISFTIRPPWYARWYSIVIGIVLLLAVVLFLFRLRLRTLEQRQQREKQQVQAQLETLKSQVNPHFLFNSFNTLMALIEEDSEEATTYLADLSDFFRYILEFREVELITVREDVKIVKTYLQLQSSRFGENLISNIHLPDEALEGLIPPLTLQLLVENAFKHNVISREKPLELEISFIDGYILVSTGTGLK